MVAFRLPPSLRPGSVVAVVAPSSPMDRGQLFRALAWLRTRYTLQIADQVFERSGYLAGVDAARAVALKRAILDPTVEAIVCARGGYGAMRIVDEVPWDEFERRPKWIVGFSDVTALHTIASARGIASIHGPNVTGLTNAVAPDERLALLDALERPHRPSSWSGLDVLWPERSTTPVTGPLVGGNLALVAAMAAAGRLVVPDGAIVALEDVTERPYRIDRMLVSLLLGGHLARAAAIVFGGFTQCEPGPDGITTETVIRELTVPLGVPVVMGAPFGHGSPNRAFVLGRRVTLQGGTLTFG